MPDQREVEEFLFREARMLDEHRYKDWESLWTTRPDAVYWVPVDPEHDDPDEHVSYIYDNRVRLASRVRQLETGVRIAQVPPSRTSRLVSNICVESSSGSQTVVTSRVLIAEHRVQTRMWAGMVTHKLQYEEGSAVIAFKRVDLVNVDDPLPTMAFLL